jgi:hypothetical protein
MVPWQGRATVVLAAALLACSSTAATSPDAGAGAGSSGGAGAAAGRGGSSGAGTGGGRSGAAGAAAPACRTETSCEPSSSGPCGFCDRGVQRSCQCLPSSTGGGFWNCSTTSACGSNSCGLADSVCDPRTQTTCEQCDAAGARHGCTCVASGTRGVWSCTSTAGSCGVSCGDRRCLAGEICVVLGQYPGVPPPDGGTGVILRPTCVVVPESCGTKQPSCATCVISAFSCSPPGTCRDVGPETFECILGGA